MKWHLIGQRLLGHVEFAELQEMYKADSNYISTIRASRFHLTFTYAREFILKVLVRYAYYFSFPVAFTLALMAIPFWKQCGWWFSAFMFSLALASLLGKHFSHSPWVLWPIAKTVLSVAIPEFVLILDYWWLGYGNQFAWSIQGLVGIVTGLVLAFNLLWESCTSIYLSKSRRFGLGILWIIATYSIFGFALQTWSGLSVDTNLQITWYDLYVMLGSYIALPMLVGLAFLIKNEAQQQKLDSPTHS